MPLPVFPLYDDVAQPVFVLHQNDQGHVVRLARFTCLNRSPNRRSPRPGVANFGLRQAARPV
jgi:hypothetical protein